MKAASLNEIKRELKTTEQERLIELCLGLARFKKESKEMLTYLLFEAHDEAGYITNIKSDIDELFDELPGGNIYFVKKGLRKILRMVNRQIKYSGIRQTEVELRIYFCLKIRAASIALDRSPVLMNLYQQQLKKIHLALAALPEDLQYDYESEIREIE